ncbi:MAG TPA: YhfC family glutamic-type intramembrane protease, partial [Clostridia bacterium]|nr:YhfC family glutamic-type intramembrane protease [Clostridia bacterium]
LGRDANALMYGAGHGGFEVLFILGLGMISNLATAAMLNAGMTDALTAGVTDGAALAQMEAAFSELAYTPSATFLVGIVERIAAVALHLSFSVLVWFAAKEQKAFWLFPLALLLHALVDFGTVVLSKFVANVWIIEAAIYAMTAFCVLIALYVWKKHARPGEPEPRREPDGDAPQEA